MEELKNTKQKNNEEEEMQLASMSDASEKSVASAAVDGRFWQSKSKKRRLDKKEDSTLSGDEGNNTSTTVSWQKKVRKRQLMAQQREKNLIEAEKEVEERAQALEENRALLGLTSSDDQDCRTGSALNKQVLDDVGIILQVAAKSKNLKGTFVKALKDAAASIKASVEVLHSRTISEETQKLIADNERLQSEVAELRKELAEFRDKIKSLTPASHATKANTSDNSTVNNIAGGLDVEALTRTIIMQTGNMINARLEALEDRLLPAERLRPPLAADRRNPKSTIEKVNTNKDNEESTTRVIDAGERKKRNTKKNNKEKDKTQPSIQRIEAQSSSPLQPSQVAQDETWATVVRRGGKLRNVKDDTTKATDYMAPKGPGTVKLRNPRSSAVVITLQPGAEERGITYAKIISRAKECVDLPSCGISEIKFKKAATGARILEVPGALSGEKADALAAKIRAALEENVAKVSRPIKCAEVRITGLDDSISPRDIVDAIVKRTGCAEDSIKTGDIKCSSMGTGTIWVRCPVMAAKKIQEDNCRLLVGWVSARVRVLEPRRLRCYRCHESGHVRAQCTAETDRSDECYRCGERGHLAKECSATPKCSLCTAANMPSEHILGSKRCSPPKSKRTRQPAFKKGTTTNNTVTEEAMETVQSI